MVNSLWIWGFCKNSVIGGLKTTNKNEIECKKNSLKSRATRLEVLGRLRGPRVLFLALGKMTYSHFPDQIFV